MKSTTKNKALYKISQNTSFLRTGFSSHKDRIVDFVLILENAGQRKRVF